VDTFCEIFKNLIMQYKISVPIRIRYLELNKTTGITDLKLIVQPPSGGEWSSISMTEVDGQGIYEASFTPDATGWWWVRVKSLTYPLNIYSKSYFVGTDFTIYPPKEDGNLQTINTKLGEVQTSPTTNTLLDRLKKLFDKLVELFETGIAKVKIWDGTEQSTVHIKTTSAKGLNSVPLGKSTGTYYPQIDEEYILSANDTYPIKINADGLIENRSAVLSDEGSFYDTFKGTVLDSGWTEVLGAGASSSVANSRYILNSGTTANAETYIVREIDYSPLRLVGKLAISQRIVNQDIYFELSDSMNPTNDVEFIRFHFTGTSNNLIRCETQSSLDTNGNEGLSEDFTIETTTNYLTYIITIAEGRVTFQIQDIAGVYSTLTIKMKEIPDLYTHLHLRVRIKNGSVAPASSTSLTIEYVRILNYNDVSIVNIAERPIAVDQIVNYRTQSLSEVVDIIVPVNTDYWILDLPSKSGIIDEIHIITDHNGFIFKINVDGINTFDEQGSNMDTQYLITNSNNCKNIGTNATGTTLDWILPIYFTKSIQIGVRNATAGKKIKAYIILYREKL
jgi:hypothetical protein